MQTRQVERKNAFLLLQLQDLYGSSHFKIQGIQKHNNHCKSLSSSNLQLFRRQVASDHYEDILSQLDNDIQQKEIQLSHIKVQDRRVSLLWILYSTILWIVYILYYLYAIHGKYENDVPTVARFLAPIVLGPLA